MSEKQLPLAAELSRLLRGSMVTQLIFVAAKLGIADQLAYAPKSIDELAVCKREL